MLRRQLKGLHTIFAKFQNSPFDLETGFNGLLRHGEHEYRNKKNLIMYYLGSTYRFFKKKKIQICL